jgi:hypothetical protein
VPPPPPPLELQVFALVLEEYTQRLEQVAPRPDPNPSPNLSLGDTPSLPPLLPRHSPPVSPSTREGRPLERCRQEVAREGMELPAPVYEERPATPGPKP